jgi:hypothetical protein
LPKLAKWSDAVYLTLTNYTLIDTLRWLLSAAPGEKLAEMVINPHRPGRHEPRVTKDRQDTYTKMVHPRSKLRITLKKQAKAA